MGIGTAIVVLTMILAILKLSGIIAISWWLVFTPTLIAVAIALVVVLIMVFLIARMK